MKNVYDILVNFKKKAYEFYEWDKEDEIKHIKAIPSFKVDDKCILDFINNNVKVDIMFLNKIIKKTEVFNGRNIRIIDYACIFYNDFTAIAIEFDSSGCVIGKSKLLFDESDDIILNGKNENILDIKYNIISIENDNNILTRNENKIIYLLSKYLKTTYEKKSYEEIKYLYFECFNHNEYDNTKAYKKLNNSVLEVNYDVINKLKSIIKVLKK